MVVPTVLTMAESGLSRAGDRLRSRYDPVGGTGDANMGTLSSKPSSHSALLDKSDDAFAQPIYKYIVCASSGFMFGFAMEKGRGRRR